MPIVVDAPDGSELTQGDILRDVPFVVVDADGAAAFDKTASHVLIISRPCKAVRDDVVVVAPVVQYPLDLAEVGKNVASPVGGLDRMRRFLSGLRDGIKGGEFTDALYLGSIGGVGTQRYAAQLTTLCTVGVPEAQGVRRAWVKAHRVGRLDGDFVRDLHTRIVLTFTRLGFDDHTWYSDPDLDVMIAAGEAEVLHLRAELVAAEQAIQKVEAAGKSASRPQKDALEALRKKVDQANAALKPYLDVRARRRGGEQRRLDG